jgi:hypothetical protein
MSARLLAAVAAATGTLKASWPTRLSLKGPAPMRPPAVRIADAAAMKPAEKR